VRSSLVIVFAAIGLVACGNDIATPSDGDATPVARATWYQDVAPIVSKHCMSCHREGGSAPFSLTDYESADEGSTRMVEYIDKGLMPPFDAHEEADCTPRFGWKDDPRLTHAEKTTLDEWIADGHARGIDAEIPRPASLDLAGVTKTLTPVQGFVTSGTRDQFVCFVLDPGNTTNQVQWMTGLQVRPGNEMVVHNAVITQVRNDLAAPWPGAADALVAQHGIGIPFICDDMATPGDFVVNLWAPGSQPMETPGEVAVPILPGSKLVMQLHYHPAGVTNEIDVTQVDLRMSSEWPRKMYFVIAFGNQAQPPNLEPGPGDLGTPRFVIPARSANHTEKMSISIPDLGVREIPLVSANPRMHLVGTHISSKIVRPAARGNQPKDECLANGGWNFDWQRTYRYDAPVDQLPTISPGDRLEITCQWNNTLANPFVQRMLHNANLPPQAIDIALGEQMTNEMCLEIFGILLDAPAQPASRTAPVDLPELGAFPQVFRAPRS
jgi:hypothetical protein